MIGAIIFDMDGVLIDAKEWHYEALNRALSLFGYAISRHDHLVTYDGLPTKKKLAMLTMERGLPQGLHSFISDLKQLYTFELVNVRCKPVFAHQYALAKLKSAGYRLAVASNSIRETVHMMLEKAGIRSYFDVILSNEDVSKAKPDPEIYSKAMEMLGFRPTDCLVLEDNINGIRAAQAAGANVMTIETVNDVSHEAILRQIRGLSEGR
ncbi:HAD family hydrolase [Planctomyces sp. SH-PL14]|uniref:HAD family hydrolase n=1 Tax=Planctomyces sp. SH-PL14 TaxID=1632864 RepID=UPI00078B1F5E|nr:HAD family phosphatase [Planctomyces sp. SH-PL14]AMV20776.1 Phosphorylated carbohydrates phosphatase [Planctomyces sp. SH-PL14]